MTSRDELLRPADKITATLADLPAEFPPDVTEEAARLMEHLEAGQRMARGLMLRLHPLGPKDAHL